MHAGCVGAIELHGEKEVGVGDRCQRVAVPQIGEALDRAVDRAVAVQVDASARLEDQRGGRRVLDIAQVETSSSPMPPTDQTIVARPPVREEIANPLAGGRRVRPATCSPSLISTLPSSATTESTGEPEVEALTRVRPASSMLTLWNRPQICRSRSPVASPCHSAATPSTTTTCRDLPSSFVR